MPQEPDEDRDAAEPERGLPSEAVRFALDASWPFPSAAEIERRFEQMIRRRWSGSRPELPADVFLVGEEIFVEVDLPGVDPEAVHARLEGTVLVIEATRHIQPPAETVRAAWRERAGGPLRRSVPLPATPSAPRIELRLEAGVLRVRIRPEPPR
jgi:HSP20 family protein